MSISKEDGCKWRRWVWMKKININKEDEDKLKV